MFSKPEFAIKSQVYIIDDTLNISDTIDIHNMLPFIIGALSLSLFPPFSSWLSPIISTYIRKCQSFPRPALLTSHPCMVRVSTTTEHSYKIKSIFNTPSGIVNYYDPT